MSLIQKVIKRFSSISVVNLPMTTKPGQPSQKPGQKPGQKPEKKKPFYEQVKEKTQKREEIKKLDERKKELMKGLDAAEENIPENPSLKGFVTNIEEDTKDNTNFRKVLYTGKNSQLVLMSLKSDEDIGEEIHDVDQFFRIDDGDGTVVINDKENKISNGSAIVVPAGAKHNIIAGKDGLKLYSIYSPPHHKDGIIHKTKEEAQKDEGDHYEGETSEENKKTAAMMNLDRIITKAGPDRGIKPINLKRTITPLQEKEINNLLEGKTRLSDDQRLAAVDVSTMVAIMLAAAGYTKYDKTAFNNLLKSPTIDPKSVDQATQQKLIKFYPNIYKGLAAPEAPAPAAPGGVMAMELNKISAEIDSIATEIEATRPDVALALDGLSDLVDKAAAEGKPTVEKLIKEIGPDHSIKPEDLKHFGPGDIELADKILKGEMSLSDVYSAGKAPLGLMLALLLLSAGISKADAADVQKVIKMPEVSIKGQPDKVKQELARNFPMLFAMKA